MGGVVIDTGNMVIRLPAEKKEKGLAFIGTQMAAKLISLHDPKQLTGFLDFTTFVLPLGRASLWRL